MKRISDIVREDKLVVDGEKMQIDDIMNKDIIIHEYRSRDGQYGPFAMFSFSFSNSKDNKRHVCVTGSRVLWSKLELVDTKHAFPVLAKVVKRDRYYDFE